MGRFTGEDLAQFVRCVRYLKRWKDYNFSNASTNGRPPGIALTAAAYYWFQPNFSSAPFSTTKSYSDLAALLDLVESILGRFSLHWDSEELEHYYRLSISSPVSPCGDFLARMSRNQMETLQSEFVALKSALSSAHNAVDPCEAAEKLQAVFGDDFPIPTKPATAVKRSPAIIGSTEAA
jgi:hypothetical protein